MLTFTVAALLLAAFYFYRLYSRTFDYWTKRGVKHNIPIPLFGNYMKNFLLRANLADFTAEMYNNFPNEQLVGSFWGSYPTLIIRDPELAKIVTVRDFNFFHRRGASDPSTMMDLLKQPAFVDDDMWRQLRRSWTPGFTSSKIKAIFPILIERTESLQASLKDVATSGQPFDIKGLMTGFTSDTIAYALFGIKCNSIIDNDDVMRQLGVKLFGITIRRLVIQLLRNVMYSTFKHLNVLADIEEETTEMFKLVMKDRNYEPSERRDFLDLFLDIKKKGGITGESIIEMNNDGTPKKVSIELNDSIIAAQCLLFFVAGFEPPSSSASYTLHELAHNPSIQSKVQEEIDNVLLKHKKLSYDAISEMTYLRSCLKEAMRMFPFGGPLVRECVQSYTFPGTNVTIDPGVRVIIPLKAYHNDPKIFPEPEEFRPERFDPAVMTPEQQMAYLPFGSGPRTCVGARLAMTMSMAGLVAVLSKYSVKPAPGAPRHVSLHPVANVINMLRGDLPMVFQERTSTSL